MKSIATRTFASLLVAATCLYLATGLVFEEGGFGFSLVLKPHPTALVLYGGGEEGAWQRANPGMRPPWRLTGKYHVLVRSDWEQGSPAWEKIYGFGYLLTLLCWPTLLLVLVGRSVVHRLRTRRSGAKI